MLSTVKIIGSTSFPEWRGERHYMVPFTKRNGLPDQLRHWQHTVNSMLANVETEDEIYLMVDQTFVKAGHTQRRPGVHVDMYWHPSISAHGGGHGHTTSPSRHDSRHCNSGSFHEGIILSSSVVGGVAYIGEWDQNFMNPKDGDCSKLDVSNLQKVIMEPNKVYAGDTIAMLHESVPVEQDCHRTLVRLNVKGWIPQ